MAIKSRRRNLRVGSSIGITLPAILTKGETTTLAANRIIVADARGEISEDDLLEFLEDVIEPRIWPWLEKRKRRSEAGT